MEPCVDHIVFVDDMHIELHERLNVYTYLWQPRIANCPQLCKWNCCFFEDCIGEDYIIAVIIVITTFNAIPNNL